MSLRELEDLGVLLPRERWGLTPHASPGTTALTVFAALLGLAAAVVIWLGQGGAATFVGLGLFLVDLGVFLVVTFLAVEDRMEGLEEIGADRPADREGGGGT